VSVAPDWSNIASAWHYAHGKPKLNAKFKVAPEDFRVIENLGFSPNDDGEHIWLYITKTKQNTDAVAKSLAKHAKVAYRDVGYAGLKDFQARTSQWFSIYKPGSDSIDWNRFEMLGVEIEIIQRHNRKLRRGTHKSNSFQIRLRQVEGDLEDLLERIRLIREHGVPNYFGEQRFGRGMNNLVQIYDVFANRKQIKNRHMQGLLYSAARSWLFNCIVSKRIENDTWSSLYKSEPANLNSTKSFFRSENSSIEIDRLLELDIHPTAPMWGRCNPDELTQYRELDEFERSVIKDYFILSEGLDKVSLEYQRRPIRIKVNDLNCNQNSDYIDLQFDLAKGQYATSVLRELVVTK